MAQLIKPQEVKVITKDGQLEVFISLELNINLNQNGLDVTAQAKEVKTINRPKEEENTAWAIPDFTSSPKINFGKND
jgi:hypothetical protein